MKPRLCSVMIRDKDSSITLLQWSGITHTDGSTNAAISLHCDDVNVDFSADSDLDAVLTKKELGKETNHQQISHIA